MDTRLPVVIKFSKQDLVCPFCKKKQQNQDLWSHAQSCTKYDEALTQEICPLCQLRVEGTMTLHFFDCKVSRKYFRQMIESKNGEDI